MSSLWTQLQLLLPSCAWSAPRSDAVYACSSILGIVTIVIILVNDVVVAVIVSVFACVVAVVR